MSLAQNLKLARIKKVIVKSKLLNYDFSVIHDKSVPL